MEHELHILIDDYHHVEDPLAHLLLQKLVDHSPGNFHITLASRATPPLSLARLRVMGLLAEIESGDLPFDIEESCEYFGQNLGASMIGRDKMIRIHEMTQGWPASLQLVSLVIRNRRRSDIDWDELLWHTDDLPAYLSGEVLNALPPDLSHFIETLSLCRRFSAGLANALTGRADAGQILDRMERENLLILRDEGSGRTPWFRFHPLFADFLRIRLARRPLPDIDRLHRKASEWFGDNGLVIDAIIHATMGHDPDRAVALAERSMASLWRLSHLGPLHHLVNAIPRHMLASNPRLVYLASLTLALTGASNQAEIWAAQLPDASGPESLFRRSLLQATIAMQRDDTQHVLELVRDMPLAAAVSPFEHQTLLGFRVTALAADGRFDEAYRLIDEDRESSPHASDGMTLLAHGARCLAALLQGRTTDALPLARQLYDSHEARRGRGSTGADLSAVAVSCLLYEMDRLDEARDMAANRDHGLKRALPQLTVLSAATEVRLARLCQSEDAALALAEEYCERFRLIRFDRGTMHLLLLQLEIFAGRRDHQSARATFEHIAKIADKHRESAGLRREIALAAACATARLSLLDRSYERGLAALDGAAKLAEILDWGRWLVSIDLLRAQLEEARAESARAQEHLIRALARGSELGLTRTFIDEGQPVLRLLRRAAATSALDAALEGYAAALLEHFARCPRLLSEQPATGPSLTPRETEILRLVAANMSNQRVADAIGITLETIKWNLKNIFQKLEVANRYDAMMQARKMGIVD